LNLLMFSGDSSVARGARGPFYQMLRHFSAYWTRIDILCRGGGDAAPTVVHGNVYVHPSPWPGLLQPLYLLRRGTALCAEQPYALIVSHDYGLFLNGIGAALLSRRTALPWASEIHHVEGYPRAVTGRERLYRALALRYISWMARRAAAIRREGRLIVPRGSTLLQAGDVITVVGSPSVSGELAALAHAVAGGPGADAAPRPEGRQP